MAELKDLLKMLQENGDKNFVQRLMNPYIFPVLWDVLQGGDVGNMMMSSGYTGNSVEGTKGFVFPQIIQEKDTGKLKKLGTRQAMDYARKTGEYLEFDTPEEAEDFGTNYKKYLGIWGGK